jgi:hypothetical protein
MQNGCRELWQKVFSGVAGIGCLGLALLAPSRVAAGERASDGEDPNRPLPEGEAALLRTVYCEMKAEQRERRTVELLTLAFYGILVGALFTGLSKGSGGVALPGDVSPATRWVISGVILSTAIAMVIRTHISAVGYDEAAWMTREAEKGLGRVTNRREGAEGCIFDLWASQPRRTKWWGRGSAYAIMITLTAAINLFVWWGRKCGVAWAIVFTMALVAVVSLVVGLNVGSDRHRPRNADGRANKDNRGNRPT